MITRQVFRITLTTAQASLGASDTVHVNQLVEGPQLRELFSDVHSVSLLVRSSVAGLNFGLFIRDSPTTKSLVKLCTIPSANTMTLIPLPNIPIFSAGNFAIAPGVVGYNIGICLGAGSTLTAPANDTWQSGNFVGAAGQDNFASKPVNSTFDIAFVQHEPGPLCTTFVDKPFSQNLDECLRYYQKSYDYDASIGTVNGTGFVMFMQSSTAQLSGSIRFPKPMAKVPTMIGYNLTTGAANSVRVSGIDYAISSFNLPGKSGFGQIFTATLPAVAAGVAGPFHYTADTGW